MAKTPALSRFRKLVDDISSLYEKARAAQVSFAWETGRRIVEVEQDGAVRARYGKALLQKLSGELSRKCGQGFSMRNLGDMRRFYLANQIRQPAAELSWSGQRELLQVTDPGMRQTLAKRAVQEGLGKRQVRVLVAKVNAGQKAAQAVPGKPAEPLKRPTGLKLNTYQKVAGAPEYLDLGFCIAYPASDEELKSVTVTATPAFTYAATVERVVDGDTFLVSIEAGFGILVRDKLRLRGVDCPELGTPEGERAKAYVTKLFPKGTRVILKSSKGGTDKYGRFVVDLFWLEASPARPGPSGGQRGDRAGGVSRMIAPEEAAEIISAGRYLNQELLDQGLAVRMVY